MPAVSMPAELRWDVLPFGFQIPSCICAQGFEVTEIWAVEAGWPSLLL